jgi:hypothetical protein
MSIYEVLVIAALAAAGGYAYYLYRSDTRPKPPGAEAPDAKAAPSGLMFGRAPKDRDGDGR